MIALDTNVLLRLFVEDDFAQCDRARRFVADATREDVCLINPVVLVEFAWTLASRMRRAKAEVVDLVEQVLSADDLEITYRGTASAALEVYRTGKADFADYFLAGIDAFHGCSSTAAFDDNALKSKLFSSIP